ncbi:MAG: hypothetical protein EGP82_11230 [Odoribacter splanchnicus]|nr:hypothetical protein [Odoribacter splanchnicus]
MKKKLVMIGAIFTFAIVLAASTNIGFQKSTDLRMNRLEAFAECENTVKVNGAIITTTVCNRKTNVGGVIANVKCNATATTSCSFTNVGTR